MSWSWSHMVSTDGCCPISPTSRLRWPGPFHEGRGPQSFSSSFFPAHHQCLPTFHSCHKEKERGANLFWSWHNSLYVWAREMLCFCQAPFLLLPGTFPASSAGLFLILLPLPWKLYLHVFPNTPVMDLCHISATAPLVTFIYFSFAVPQNATQAVAGFAVIKHVTHTVRLAGLF